MSTSGQGTTSGYDKSYKEIANSYKKTSNTSNTKKYVLFMFIIITVLITLLSFILSKSDKPILYNSFFSIANSSFYVLSTCIVIFIVILSLVIFDTNIFTTKSKEETTRNILLLLFSSVVFITLCITFLPGLRDLKNLFQQINSATYIIIYTIFTVMFYTLMPTNILNKHPHIINGLMLLLGIAVYYKGFSKNYTELFDINYEKIKMVIIFLCLMTVVSTIYIIDPGKIVEKYKTQTFLITFITSILAFLYLLVTIGVGYSSSIGIYGLLIYILFIAGIFGYVIINKSELAENNTKSASIITLVLLISILSTVLLGCKVFSDTNQNIINSNNYNLYKKGLLGVIGLVISGLFIYYIANAVENLSGKTSIVSFILTVLLISIILSLIFKTMYTDFPYGNIKKNAFFNILINTILYIPCILGDTFNWIGKIAVGEYNATSTGSFIMLFVAICLIIAYFKTPSLVNLISTQGGNQLVNKPVATDTEINLGTYEDLNGSDSHDYQYAISFWLYLDSAPPNTNPNYNNFTSVLNFGNKPNILYNSKKNTLMITMQQKDLKRITKNKLIDFDSDGNRIIYTNTNFLLQKWNNIIINYNGGTMDIFLNGELVKSSIEVVPYYTLDKLTIGENGGIKGGISNLVYFKHVLTTSNIYYLYNSVKNRSPPVLNESNETIIAKHVNTPIM
jgi:drug/metabolite transporter (DMT)-like permease